MSAEASSVASSLRQRISLAVSHVPRLPPQQQPVVVLFEWTDPIFPAGHWTPQLLAMAGAQHPLNPPCLPSG